MADLTPTFIGRKLTKKTDHDRLEKTLIDNVSKIVGNSKGIISVMDATHSGFVNGNLRKYETPSFAQNYDKFYTPFPKPFNKHHDTMNDPIGRIHSAMFVPGSYQMPDGQKSDGLIKVAAFIPSGAEADKIMNGTHMTVSTGFEFDSVKCSICGFDWMKYRRSGNGWPTSKKGSDEEMDPDKVCMHQRGKMYKDSMAYYSCNVRDFLEVSAVNEPADLIAHIISYAEVGKDSVLNTSFYHDIDFRGNDNLGYACKPIGYTPLTNGVTIEEPNNDNKAVMDAQEEAMFEQVAKELKETVGILSATVQKNTDALNLVMAKLPNEQRPADSSGTVQSATDKTENQMEETRVKQIVADEVKTAVDALRNEMKLGLDSIKESLKPTAPAGEPAQDSASAAAEPAPAAEDSASLKKEIENRDSKIADLESKIKDLEEKLAGAVKPQVPARKKNPYSF